MVSRYRIAMFLEDVLALTIFRSIAIRYLIEQSWIASRESKAESKGRPVKIYELARPINEIMDSIEKEKKKEANTQLALVQKLREYIC